MQNLSSMMASIETIPNLVRSTIMNIDMDNLLARLPIDKFNTETFFLALSWLWQCVTISNFWKALVLFMIAINFKNFPLIYHLRVLNGIRFVLRSQRPSRELTPEQLFQPLIVSSKAPLMEIDVFGHKSNSTYFSDIDIARTHFVTTMFGKAIEKHRGSTTMNGLSGKPRSAFTMPLGAVSCCFRRELKPYETYDMWTRILAWDQKWFYLVTHFVKRGAGVNPTEYTMYPQQNKKSGHTENKSRNPPAAAIAASALSKVVFKNGRVTVAPIVMLELAGLIPKAASKEQEVAELSTAQVKANLVETVSIRKATRIVDMADASSSDSGYDSPRRGSTDGMGTAWTRERIEAERQRGMKQAQLLADQSKLEEEFSGSDRPALGRHYDGHGIEGVLSTLAQLGKLSSYQLL